MNMLDSIINKLKSQFPEAPKPMSNEMKMPIEYEDRSAKACGGMAKRKAKAEGGEMMMQDAPPVDTYPNVPPEEMAAVEASQLPDEEMEQEYIGHLLDQSLDESEQEYLLNVLETDEKLSDIFDRVLLSASEFSGAGPVEGPGDGTSDSIPARLSDGEFVFTKKATDQIGAENLQQVMDDAERAYDGGLMKKAVGGVITDPLQTEKYRKGDPYEDKQEEQVNQLMIGANRMPSLLTR